MTATHMHFFHDLYAKQSFWCTIRDAKDPLVMSTRSAWGGGGGGGVSYNVKNKQTKVT